MTMARKRKPIQFGQQAVMPVRRSDLAIDIGATEIFVAVPPNEIQPRRSRSSVRKLARLILEFCNLQFEPSCVEFYKVERSIYTASSEQVRRWIFRGGLLQWQSYKPWLGPINDALDDALIRYRE
jgi:hypothetical protein